MDTVNILVDNIFVAQDMVDAATRNEDSANVIRWYVILNTFDIILDEFIFGEE